MRTKLPFWVRATERLNPTITRDHVRILVLALVIAVALTAYGTAWWYETRITAEVTGGLLMLVSVVRAFFAGRWMRAAREKLRRLELDFDSKVAQAESVARIRGDMIFDEKKKLEDKVWRLDQSGLFLVACLRWKMEKGKKAHPSVNGVTLDADYWWKAIERVARSRWPGRSWQPNELQEAVDELLSQPDSIRWRLLTTSEFGLSVSPQ